MSAHATIRDVAKAAGVSVATVSRVFSGQDSVTEKTREKVASVARALRFVPHSGARSLSTRKTDTVGVLLPDLYGEFFSELIRGIDNAARRHGLHLMLSSSHGDAGEMASAIRSMRGRVDGLLIMSPQVDDAWMRQHVPAETPVVVMGASAISGDLRANAANTIQHPPAISARIDHIDIDNYGGAVEMTRHLLACGHRHLAFISGPPHNHDAALRVRGFSDTVASMRDARIVCITAGDFTEASGSSAADAILGLGQRVDAIFSANDEMAIGCLLRLRAKGWGVPQDIAVVGFDDIPISGYIQPALTTMRVHMATLGASAIDQLARMLPENEADAPVMPRTAPLMPALIIRQSCAPPRAEFNPKPTAAPTPPPHTQHTQPTPNTPHTDRNKKGETHENKRSN